MSDLLPLSLLAAEGEPLLRKLDPVLRTQVLMALLGLVLIGLLLVLLIMMGGRFVRRLARHRTGASAAAAQDDWYRKPLATPERPSDNEP
jgi:hypothetical protein